MTTTTEISIAAAWLAPHEEPSTVGLIEALQSYVDRVAALGYAVESRADLPPGAGCLGTMLVDLSTETRAYLAAWFETHRAGQSAGAEVAARAPG